MNQEDKKRKFSSFFGLWAGFNGINKSKELKKKDDKDFSSRVDFHNFLLYYHFSLNYNIWGEHLTLYLENQKKKKKNENSWKSIELNFIQLNAFYLFILMLLLILFASTGAWNSSSCSLFLIIFCTFQ